MKKITVNNEVYIAESDVNKELSKKNIKPTWKRIEYKGAGDNNGYWELSVTLKE